MSEPRRQTEPKPLTAEYHKARTQLMLLGGLLMVWALIGVDLEKAEKTGGTISSLISSRGRW